MNTKNVYSSGQKHGNGFIDLIFKLFFLLFVVSLDNLNACQDVGQ